MALYHFNAHIIQRSKGHSAVAGAAYISGSKIVEERTGITHDYSRKRGVVQSEIIAPGLANNWMYDRNELWNRVEEGEKRKDAQIARSIVLALPSELTDQQRADLVFDYARDTFVNVGMVADISIHRPHRKGDDRNHHAHVILTMREIEGEGFSRKKQRAWNDDAMLEHWREEWANYQNAALEKYGHDARVDHRTLEEQGIDREATYHLGKTATAIERKGEASRIGDENRAVEERNAGRLRLAMEHAELQSEIAEEQERQAKEAQPKAWTLAITGAYKEPQRSATYEEVKAHIMSQPSLEQQPEEQGRQERRWYETAYTRAGDFYARAKDRIQHYWQSFVSRAKDERDDIDSEYELER